MNTLQINTGNVGGGAETVASDIQKHLLTSGRDSHSVIKQKLNLNEIVR